MRHRPFTSFSLRLVRDASPAVARWLAHVSRRFDARLTFVSRTPSYEAALDCTCPIVALPTVRALLEVNLALLDLAMVPADAPPRSVLGGRR